MVRGSCLGALSRSGDSEGDKGTRAGMAPMTGDGGAAAIGVTVTGATTGAADASATGAARSSCRRLAVSCRAVAARLRSI